MPLLLRLRARENEGLWPGVGRGVRAEDDDVTRGDDDDGDVKRTARGEASAPVALEGEGDDNTADAAGCGSPMPHPSAFAL